MKKLANFGKEIQSTISADKTITLCMLALMGFGTLMVLSTEVGKTTTSAMVMVSNCLKQVIYWFLAFACVFFMSKWFSFKRFRLIQPLGFVILFVAMLLPFAFSASGGSHAWIRLPLGFTIQPAEFLKPFMILMVASAVYRTKKKQSLAKEPKKMFRFSLIAMACFFVELIAQKDLGTLSILFVAYVMCIMVLDYPSLKKFQHWFIVLALVAIVAAILLFGVTDIGTQLIAKTPFSHVAVRIENMKNPFNDVYGDGYQPANSLYGIGSSNILGRGIGNSMRKYGYLTQAENDYILAVIIEETGIFGLGYIVFFYFVLIRRLFYFALQTSELTYKVTLVGIATYISMHFILNVGGVACLIPFTGVPLLFISNGGSSLFTVCLSIGLAQNCIRHIKNKEIE